MVTQKTVVSKTYETPNVSNSGLTPVCCGTAVPGSDLGQSRSESRLARLWRQSGRHSLFAFEADRPFQRGAARGRLDIRAAAGRRARGTADAPDHRARR